MSRKLTRRTTTGQIQAMIGILALEDQACGANIRTLHYRWLSGEVNYFGIYSHLQRLKELGWAKTSAQQVTMLASEVVRTSPVYRLTEAGERALVRAYADMLWLGEVNSRAQRGVMTKAQRLISDVVARAKDRIAA